MKKVDNNILGKTGYNNSFNINNLPFPDKPATETYINFKTFICIAQYVYYSGVIFFLLLLIIQIIRLIHFSNTFITTRDGRFRMVEIGDEMPPCSFGNNIYINPHKYDLETYNQILMHEKIHVRQKHSVDMLFIQIVIAFQWFNPFVWKLKKSLEANLEFLTDDIMLKDKTIGTISYQLNLLRVSSTGMSNRITINYNQSMLKKRIVMINKKKSSLISSSKYMFFVSILTCIILLLNKPEATMGQPKHLKYQNQGNDTLQNVLKPTITTKGSWQASINGDSIKIRLNGDNQKNSQSSDFYVSKQELYSNQPKGQGEGYIINRQAGILRLEGKLNNKEGYGHYYFTPNKDFLSSLSDLGISELSEEDAMTFFLINVNKDLAKDFRDKGYGAISKDFLIKASFWGVDKEYIDFLYRLGYSELKIDDILMLKALQIDSTFINDIHNAGYDHLQIEDLVRFKNQKIDSHYIDTVSKLLGKGHLSTDEIFQLKFSGIEPSYIKSLKGSSYLNESIDQVISLKVAGIDAAFIKTYADLGYKDIPIHYILWFKSMAVGPDFIKALNKLGYNNIPCETLFALHIKGVTPNFVASMKSKGFNPSDLMKYIELKESFKG